MKNNFPTVNYFLAVFIYGTIGYFLHFINYASEFVVFCRGLIGSIYILFVLFIRKEKIDFKAIKANLLLLVVSGISLGLNWVFLFAGYRYSVSLSSLCNYTAPIIVLIITTLFSKNKLSFKQIICAATSFVGIVLISGVLNFKDNNDFHAIIYGLLAAIGFVVLVLCNRRLKDIGQLERTFVQLFVSALTVLPFVLINHSFPTSLDSRSFYLILLLGFLHTGIAYIFYFGSIDKLEPIKIVVIGYVEPVLSVLIGALLLNEKMNVHTILGAVLIIGSALICEVSSIKKINYNKKDD